MTVEKIINILVFTLSFIAAAFTTVYVSHQVPWDSSWLFFFSAGTVVMLGIFTFVMVLVFQACILATVLTLLDR